MAFYRRSTKRSFRRRPRRYRRRYRKRTRAARMNRKGGMYDSKIYYFKQSVDLTSNSSFALSIPTSGASQYGGWNFQLSQVPTYQDFTTLYDQYKICGVKVKVIPSVAVNTVVVSQPTQSDPIGTSQATLPSLYYVFDPNDSATITTYQDIFSYQKWKTKRLNRPWSIWIKPRFNADVSGSSIKSSRGFLNTTLTTVPHYGIKWAIPGELSTIGENYVDAYNARIIATYYLAFKTVR